MDGDTETLIALVSSLLPQYTYSQDVILDALIQTNGDIKDAVEVLQSKTPTKKRNHSSLDSWLTRPAKKISTRKDSPAPRTSIIKPYTPTTAASSSVNFMSVLRKPPSDAPSTPSRLPPLTLSTPALVAKHTPCTLHLSVLSQELACKLFYTMVDASKEWNRNKWWIADKVVESPHLTSFYVRNTDELDKDEAWQETAQYWCVITIPRTGMSSIFCRYNGRAVDPPPKFPSVMEEACKIVERIVNQEMKKRQRFKLEWNSSATGDADSLWRANVAASNRYQGGKESVGFHSDQLTYLGPYPTIASLSLGIDLYVFCYKPKLMNLLPIRYSKELQPPGSHTDSSKGSYKLSNVQYPT